MKLTQKRGRQYDALELAGDRIRHAWSLKKETGERSTDVANLDPAFAVTTKKNEGRLPYFVIGLSFLLLLWFGFPGEGLYGRVLTGLFAGACLASFLVGCLMRKTEHATILHLNDGSVFAVICHHWVAPEEREAFLAELETRIEAVQSNPLP